MAKKEENKNENKKSEKEIKNLTIAERKARHGIFTTTSIIVVIAIVIALNIFLSSKNWSYDFTSNKIYTLSEGSKKIAKNLKDDQKITIYFLNKESEAASVYKSILNQYKKASKNIKVEYKDLKLYPNFANKYLTGDQKAAADDIIVVCNDRSRLVSSSDYLSYDYNESGDATTSINLEPKITAAINYVTSDSTPVIYTLSGQGEGELGTNITDGLSTDNYDVQALDIVSAGAIPKDCSLLVINAPTNDLNTTITDMLKEYMNNGGKLLVILDPNKMYKNLNKFLTEYGVKVEEGIIVETGSGYYMNSNPTYLLPTLCSHEITKPISTSDLHILAPVSKGLSAVDDVKDYKVTDLLQTSAESYSKVDTSSEDIQKTDEDIEGPLAVAQVVDNSKGEGVMVVCGSSSMGVNEIDDYVSKANSNFYSNAVNYLTDQDSKIAVKATKVTNSYAVFTAFATKMVMALGVVGIPLFILIIGFVVWFVRRNS